MSYCILYDLFHYTYISALLYVYIYIYIFVLINFLSSCHETNVWSIRCLLTSILAYIAFTFAVSLLSHGHAARIIRVILNCSTTIYERLWRIASCKTRHRDCTYKKSRNRFAKKKKGKHDIFTVRRKIYLYESYFFHTCTLIKRLNSILKSSFENSDDDTETLCVTIERSCVKRDNLQVLYYTYFSLIEIRMPFLRFIANEMLASVRLHNIWRASAILRIA